MKINVYDGTVQVKLKPISTECHVQFAEKGKDGKDGRTPEKDVDYTDGFSPLVEVEKIEDGYKVKITDAQGVKSFEVKNGEPGPKGDKPEKDVDYRDGYSPTVTVEENENGYKVEITDVNGTRSLNIKHGKDATGAADWTNITGKPDTFPPSTHSHTAAQVGAAPSGFGLGETNSKQAKHCDEAVLPGFYHLNGNENTGYPSDFVSFRYGSVIVNRRYSTVFQTIIQGGVIAHRYGTTSDGGVTWTFNPWEYENPPLVAGVEYRTTERYKGNNPVYVKLINFGAMPNTTAKSVSIGANLNIVSIEGMTYNGDYALPLSIHNGINSVYYNKSDGKLYVDTKNDATKWSAEIVVKYTK